MAKYSEELTRQIVEAMEGGLPNKYAAQSAGISEDTFYSWQKEHSEFSEAIKKAEVARVKTLVGDIKQDRTWQSKAWLLERLDRAIFHLPTATEKDLLERLEALENEHSTNTQKTG